MARIAAGPRGTVEAAGLAALLAEAETQTEPPRPLVRQLRPRPGGGSRPWDAETHDGARYVVKCANNEQDSRRGPPLKVLSTELICGRLGRLFAPPLCPEPAVVEVPPAVAATAWHPRTRRRLPRGAVPGPAFGSRLVEGACEIKGEGAARLPGVPAAAIARLAVFQTWLRGVDVSALITPDGRILSVDHGYYLTNDRWDPVRLARLPVRLKLPSQVVERGPLADPALFAPALEELAAIPEARIVASCAHVPVEWGLSLELRAQVAACLLLRREGVPRAVAALWRRRPRPVSDE